jgi:hypothetical protein
MGMSFLKFVFLMNGSEIRSVVRVLKHFQVTRSRGEYFYPSRVDLERDENVLVPGKPHLASIQVDL